MLISESFGFFSVRGMPQYPPYRLPHRELPEYVFFDPKSIEDVHPGVTSQFVLSFGNLPSSTRIPTIDNCCVNGPEEGRLSGLTNSVSRERPLPLNSSRDRSPSSRDANVGSPNESVYRVGTSKREGTFSRATVETM